MSSQPIPYPLRMPEELRDRLTERCRINGRSLNAEIIAMLLASLDAESTLAAVPADALLKELAARLDGRLELVIRPEVADREGLIAVDGKASARGSRKAPKI